MAAILSQPQCVKISILGMSLKITKIMITAESIYKIKLHVY